jgi:hypothetical protein
VNRATEADAASHGKEQRRGGAGTTQRTRKRRLSWLRLHCSERRQQAFGDCGIHLSRTRLSGVSM